MEYVAEGWIAQSDKLYRIQERIGSMAACGVETVRTFPSSVPIAIGSVTFGNVGKQDTRAQPAGCTILFRARIFGETKSRDGQVASGS